jgi:hypothetical protein
VGVDRHCSRRRCALWSADLHVSCCPVCSWRRLVCRSATVLALLPSPGFYLRVACVFYRHRHFHRRRCGAAVGPPRCATSARSVVCNPGFSWMWHCRTTCHICSKITQVGERMTPKVLILPQGRSGHPLSRRVPPRRADLNRTPASVEVPHGCMPLLPTTGDDYVGEAQDGATAHPLLPLVRRESLNIAGGDFRGGCTSCYRSVRRQCFSVLSAWRRSDNGRRRRRSMGLHLRCACCPP